MINTVCDDHFAYKLILDLRLTVTDKANTSYGHFWLNSSKTVNVTRLVVCSEYFLGCS